MEISEIKQARKTLNIQICSMADAKQMIKNGTLAEFVSLYRRIYFRNHDNSILYGIRYIKEKHAPHCPSLKNVICMNVLRNSKITFGIGDSIRFYPCGKGYFYETKNNGQWKDGAFIFEDNFEILLDLFKTDKKQKERTAIKFGEF